MKFYTGMFGLGDSIYQRAVVRELCKQGEIYLTTAWPQLYSDLPVKAVKPNTRLRTQHKNISRHDIRHLWHYPPTSTEHRIAYRGQGTMLAGMLTSAGINTDTVKFDLPSFAKKERRPYIVVRPATIRTEWIATARNPDPRYLCEAIDILRQDFDIVSVADLDGSAEFAVNPLPYADTVYHRGELQVEELMSLVENAAGVVGGVGWILPAALAYKTPMLLLYGGWGQINGAQHVLDPRISTENLHQVFPDKFCMCNDRMHECDRTITGLSERVDKFRSEIMSKTTESNDATVS